jgi:transcriptional regulator NrdR family protein
MVCIYCGHKTDVINSRPQKRHNKVWRRRRCTACEAVFTTTESASLSESLVIARSTAKAGYHPFLRDKLFLSVYNSCQHRKSAVADASALTETILGDLPTISQNGLVDRQALRETTLQVLTRFDTVAAVHYAAFHKD